MKRNTELYLSKEEKVQTNKRDSFAFYLRKKIVFSTVPFTKHIYLRIWGIHE